MNFLDSILILIVFIIKDVPLVVKVYEYNLTQGLGYFGRKFNEKSLKKQRFILTIKLLTNKRLLYNFIYALIVGLVFYNKLFASILLLDVLAHIPSLSNYYLT